MANALLFLAIPTGRFVDKYPANPAEEIGGTKSLMGLTVTVSSLFGIPALLFSDVIFCRIGNHNVQIIGFLAYIIRLIGNNCYYFYKLKKKLNSNYRQVSRTFTIRTCA